MITAFWFVLLITASFTAGWVLRGMLCLRRGGCEAAAQTRIEALEAELAIERMVRR